ncbi:dipeptidase PepE [Namhaeicola litoreus]|uniref:Dipeptidase PepE n=1 Tax=Namhaeicola litoreus TaxID=1052145 RepID=A0ABW3Y655_9FLAO
MKKMIIASTSTIYGGQYLGYLLPELIHFFKSVNEILFIPYARPGGIAIDDYTFKAQEAFSKLGKQLSGIHEFEDPRNAICNADAIFTGGGNTFLLVKTLHDLDLMNVLSDSIKSGTPYLGTSAGSNITGPSMQTTNDMPIVYPPSFTTLNCIPYQINPHYVDPDPNSKHQGETRETRIKEYHTLNDSPVVGLREGSWLEVIGEKIVLKGDLKARIFRKDEPTIEIESGTFL